MECKNFNVNEKISGHAENVIGHANDNIYDNDDARINKEHE